MISKMGIGLLIRRDADAFRCLGNRLNHSIGRVVAVFNIDGAPAIAGSAYSNFQ